MLHTAPCVILRAPEQGVSTAPGFPIAGGRRSGVVPCDNAPVATFLNCVHSDWIQGACVQTEAPPAWSASSLLPRPVWLHLVFSAASIVGACNESAMSSIMNGRVSPKQAAVLLQEVFREACSAGLTYNGLTWYDSSVVMRTSCTTAVAP